MIIPVRCFTCGKVRPEPVRAALSAAEVQAAACSGPPPAGRRRRQRLLRAAARCCQRLLRAATHGNLTLHKPHAQR
jgi:hypothetical protein